MRPNMRKLLTGAAGLLIFVAGTNNASADAQRGQVIAEQWCSACHLVSPEQVRALDGVPTFGEIARRGDVTADGLRVFLSTPHPVMPDMALTRDEIRDIVRYLNTLE